MARNFTALSQTHFLLLNKESMQQNTSNARSSTDWKSPASDHQFDKMQPLYHPESPTRRRNTIAQNNTRLLPPFTKSPLRQRVSPLRNSPKQVVRSVPIGSSPYSTPKQQRKRGGLPLTPFQDPEKSKPLLQWINFVVGLVFVSLVMVPYVAQTKLLRMTDSATDQENQIPIPANSNNRIQTSGLSLDSTRDLEIKMSPVAPSIPIPEEKLKSRFAFAYVVGGCNPERPVYRNFLYNIMINSQTLVDTGSNAKVIVFIQMTFDSAQEKLPSVDEQMLGNMNIRVEYIPQPQSVDQSLKQLMMEKFRVLSLTEFDRIMYMDSDVLLRGNLDYLFELSLNGSLKENVVFATEHEPASGTFFMLSPQDGDWERIESIEASIQVIPDAPFDAATGWGRAIPKGDEYELLGIGSVKGSSWDFRDADVDAGLLYHFVKYEKKEVSIIMGSSVKNFGANASEEVDLGDLMKDQTTTKQCWKGTHGSNSCVAPYSDIVHFPGATKPWLHKVPKDISESNQFKTPLHFWFHKLDLLDKKLSIGVDLGNWQVDSTPLLGLSGETEMVGTAYNEPQVVASPYTHNVTATAHRFAYAYVIGGCKPEDPSYRNYLNDIMISTFVGREEGSQADVIVFIQMAFESDFDTLTDEDMRLMKAMDIRIRYIPKAKDESFYRIMLDKFRVLSLTEYDRVVFMDGDVMAVGNLDYLFELSMAGILKENLVFAGVTEPANGGCFMLAPKEGALDRIHEIIKEKELRGAQLPYPHWDENVGWGHKIEEGDYWQFLNKRGKKQLWDFYGAFADQGLLFHYVKYEAKSVSIVFRKEVEHWGIDADGKPRLEGTFGLDIFGDRIEHKCWVGTMKLKPCRAPHSDFVHFTGKKKPWLAGPPDDIGEKTKMDSAAHFWFQNLSILNDKMKIGLDFTNWRKGHRPFLGLFPQHKHAAKTTYTSSLR